MKKHNQVLIYVLSSLIGVLFLISFALYSRLNNLNKTLDQLYITNSEKDLKQINSLIFESHFKDDLVLSNFNISITIIIAFFTVLIALGAVFSFKRVDDEIENLKKYKIDITNIIKGLNENKSDTQLKQEESISFIFLSHHQEITTDCIKLNFYYKEKHDQSFDGYEIYHVITSSFIKLNSIKNLLDNYVFKNKEIEKNINDIYKDSEDCILNTLELTNKFLQSNIENFSPTQRQLLNICISELRTHLKISTFNTLKEAYSNLERTINQNTH
ncbi:hypothetical protein [Myroides fluvii]|uniref:hypothetical protein n=1 Tax=Myroides fluvii TaxID=2572594 RepID=UPI00131DC052|nr:hypothetical protein [Myroides fluvii]